MQDLLRGASSKSVEEPIATGGGHDEQICRKCVRSREYRLDHGALPDIDIQGLPGRVREREGRVSGVDEMFGEVELSKELMQEQERALGSGMMSDRYYDLF